MITVWNRKELFCTFDMKKQAEVRDILWKFDISYEMRVSDRADFFVSGRTTSTDADIDHQTEYLIMSGRKTMTEPCFGTEKFEGISGNEKKTEKKF